MSEFNQSLLIANIYRYLLIVVGGCSIYWGYRLFEKGYFERGGELKAKFGEHYLMVKQVWPGVFFAALGVLAIGVGVVRGITISIPTANGNSTGMMSFPKKEDPCEKASTYEWNEGQGKLPYRKDRADTVPPLPPGYTLDKPQGTPKQ